MVDWRDFVAVCGSQRVLASSAVCSDSTNLAAFCTHLEAWRRGEPAVGPLLSHVARAVCSTPATSASAERFFSVLTFWDACGKRTRAHTTAWQRSLAAFLPAAGGSVRQGLAAPPPFTVSSSSVRLERQEQGQALVTGLDGLAVQLVSSRAAPAARACSISGASSAP